MIKRFNTFPFNYQLTLFIAKKEEIYVNNETINNIFVYFRTIVVEIIQNSNVLCNVNFSFQFSTIRTIFFFFFCTLKFLRKVTMQSKSHVGIYIRFVKREITASNISESKQIQKSPFQGLLYANTQRIILSTM